MKILLYNPDNGVTRNFMPHLWMFLLKTLTPPGHEVVMIDGNVRAMDDEELVRFVREEQIGLVGIGAMTRMIAKAYRVADVIRTVGVPVVMGGPHVSRMADEALGRDGGPQHADAVAVGEADETWPTIVEDAARGTLKSVYTQIDKEGREGKPELDPYPSIPWDTLDLDQFDLVPSILRPIFKRLGAGWGKFRIIPIETGRGCPYGCEFCTVTGFFGGSIRFRTNRSIVDELLRIKARTRREGGQIAVFFVDDNFAINVKRTKSLLRDIIAAGAELNWVGQVSVNLLKDDELIDLMYASGCKWIFIGMESIDAVNLSTAHKGHNNPAEYAAVLERLADRDIFAITSFIFGMDNDTRGVAERTLQKIRSWPPGLPVFGQLTPYPATPLYDRLESSGRLDRPKHWMDFSPFKMAHIPLKMTASDVQEEINLAWVHSYSPEMNAHAIDSISDKHVGYSILHLVARLFFRGIYFPQLGKWVWMRVITQNRRTIFKLIRKMLWNKAPVYSPDVHIHTHGESRPPLPDPQPAAGFSPAGDLSDRPEPAHSPGTFSRSPHKRPPL